MAIVKDGEAVFTVEGSKVYLEILRRIVVMDAKDIKNAISRDSGDFLRLIVDHIQGMYYVAVFLSRNIICSI